MAEHAAAYIRLSKEDHDSTSPARQRADIQRLADANGWSLDVYDDIDVSAYSGVRRPAFEDLLSKLDKYDVLVCWKLDRLVRRTKDLARIVEACGATVRLVSVTEGQLGGGPGGQFVLSIFAGLAQLEGDTISLRVKSSQDWLVRQGRFRGGTRPYGYRTVARPDGGRVLEPDPHERAVVEEIARRIVAGESGRAIAWDLNVRGVSTARGKQWQSRSLIRMMRSPNLLGQTVWHGKVVLDDEGLPIQVAEPLLDVFTWRRVQAELDARSSGPRRRADANLLGGIVKCGRCGSTMTGWSADHPNAVYSCDTRSQRGPTFCSGNAINRMKLDELMIAATVRTLTADVLADARRNLAAQARPDPAAAKIASLEDALSRLEHDRQVLGLYDADEDRYARRWRGYVDELEQLRRSRPAPLGSSLAEAVPPDGLDPAMMNRAQLRRVMLAAVRSVTIAPLSGKKRWDPDRVTDIVWTWTG